MNPRPSNIILTSYDLQTQGIKTNSSSRSDLKKKIIKFRWNLSPDWVILHNNTLISLDNITSVNEWITISCRIVTKTVILYFIISPSEELLRN